MNNLILIPNADKTLHSVFKSNNYLTVLSNRKDEELKTQIQSSGILNTLQFDSIRGDANKPNSIVAMQMLNIDLGLTRADLTKIPVHILGDRDTDMQLVKQLQKEGINANGILLDIHGVSKLNKNDSNINFTKNMQEIQTLFNKY